MWSYWVFAEIEWDIKMLAGERVEALAILSESYEHVERMGGFALESAWLAESLYAVGRFDEAERRAKAAVDAVDDGCKRRGIRCCCMTRIVFSGGQVFDGTGAPPADADVVIQDGRIVDVGPGLDGDERVDVAGKTLLPGLFDCHVHLASRYEDKDEARVMNEPFSLPFFRIAENLRTTLALGITTVRDASGADAGLKMAVEQGVLRVRGCRSA